MSPFLQEGDEVVIDINNSGIALGDIVVYRDEWNKVVAHRIVNLSPLQIKGDRTLYLETNCKPFGKVAIIKRNGKLLDLKKNPLINKLMANLSIHNKEGNLFRKLWIIPMILIHFFISWSYSERS